MAAAAAATTENDMYVSIHLMMDAIMSITAAADDADDQAVSVR